MFEVLLLAWAVISAAAKGVAVNEAINDAIREMADKINEYQTRIDEVTGEAVRKTAQAEKLLTEEKAAAEAEKAAVTVEEARKEKQAAKMHELAVASFTRRLADIEASKLVADARRTQLIAEAREKYRYQGEELAAQLADIDTNFNMEITEIDRKMANLITNKDAEIAELVRQQEQLLVATEETYEQLQLKAALEDTESARKVAQIEKYRDENLKATRDDTILTLNEAGAQNKFEVGQATIKEQMEIASAQARASAGGIRRSGSPLMAMRQNIQAAQEEAARAAAAADYTLTIGASRLTAKLTQYRSQASGNIEDVWSANTLFDADLDMQRQRAETQFTQTNENLEASKVVLERQYTQDYEAFEAEKNVKAQQSQMEKARIGREEVRLDVDYSSAESGFEYDRIQTQLTYEQTQAGIGAEKVAEEVQYDQQIEDYQAAAAESKRQTDAALAREVERIGAVKEGITASADLLTAEYGRRKEELRVESVSLQSTRLAKIGAAILGAGGDILLKAESLLSRAAPPQETAFAASGVGTGSYESGD